MKSWFQAVIIVGSLFSISWVAFSQQGAKPPASEQGVDWGIFLPKGEGQFQTSVYCSSCHSLQLIVRDRRTDVAGWDETIQEMVFTNEAAIEEQDMAIIAKYLGQFFGPSTPKLELPIHVNIAPKQTLALLGALTEADVQKILDARTKEKVKDFSALEAIVGAGKLAKYKSVISFDDESSTAK
jgi:hypothetical protein